ncbi:MAG: SDR family oxidoreductase [Bacteroidetes bacterium]|nr:SDR family oxidoreductase [Bacteroidota bacterium]
MERYAVVTGATQGIGHAIATRLLSEGFHLGCCARTESDLRQVKAAWQRQAPQAKILALPADFEHQEAVFSFSKAIRESFPRVDVLVNNAGIFQPGSIAEEPAGQLEAMMRVNLFGAYDLTRELLPLMQAGSHIFNLCSVASLRAYPNGGAYSITKYALLGFSDNLRFELGPKGIRVTAICPGATWSRSWSESGLSRDRFMETEDVASVLWNAYSLSEKADLERIILRPTSGDV